MMCFPWSFKKLFKHIIVQTTLLEQGLVTSSFLFGEVSNIGFSLLYQSFEQLTIVDAPQLWITTTDAIADLLFELIGARTDAPEATMKASKSKDFQSLCVSEKKNDTEVSYAHKENKLAKISSEDNKKRTLVWNKYRICPVLEVMPEEFVKNFCCPRRQRSLASTRLLLLLKLPPPATGISSPINNIHI